MLLQENGQRRRNNSVKVIQKVLQPLNNNATVGGALVPFLTLGIPGSVGIAIITGAFIIHGIQPGPMIFTNEPNLVYGIMFGFLLTTVAMYILGRFLTPMFSRVLTVPNPILVPIVLVLSVVAVFAEHGSFFNVWFALLIGVIGYIMKVLNFSLASFVIAFVLGPIIEVNFRRSLILSEGSLAIFFTRPISLVIALIIIVVLVLPLIKKFKKSKVNQNLLVIKRNKCNHRFI